MSSAGKRDLLSIIEQQKEKIGKYESKLSDLIRAYKSLAKEKEALQASLAALSENSVKTPESSVTSKQTRKGDNELDQADCSEESMQNSPFEPELENTEVTSLRNKVLTLTATLQTLNKEKNKLEQSTKAERIRILEERKQIEDKLKVSTEEWEKLKNDYETKLHDLKNKIIVFQHESEKDSNNGKMMLREVEGLLSKERNEKEKIENLLDECQEQNRQFSLALGTRGQEKKQQRQISDLQNELEQVRCRLKKAEEQCNDPPILKRFQEQMEQMKIQYMNAVLQEQKRAEAAESSVRNLSQAHEERVAALEGSLSELSQTAAKYHNSKQNFRETIHSLKERIAELSEENKSLFSTSENSLLKNKPIQMDRDHPDALIENFVSLWKQLMQLENERDPGIGFRAEDFLTDIDVIHCKCIEDYKQLEQKMEELKKKSIKEDSGNSCRCGLKEQNEDLRDRIRSMNASIEATQAFHENQVSTLREELKTIRHEHQEHIKHLKQEHRVTVANLEQQLSGHCERSLLTLQDRDEEIHRLSLEIYQLQKEAQSQPNTVAAALLSQVSVGGTDGPLLHHLEDLARKELEVSTLHKEKIQLEKSMRDIQMSMIEKQHAMHDTIEDLREEVERLTRNASREGENLEYLKNVVLRYMTCIDADSRLLILNAIAAILKFTPQEMESVKNCLALWWWQAPAKNKGGNRRISMSSTLASSSFSSSKHGRSRFHSDNEC